MADETTYQQHGETFDPAYEAVPGAAYDAAPEAAYGEAAYEEVPAGVQEARADVDLGSTTGMQHVPLQVQLGSMEDMAYDPVQMEIAAATPLAQDFDAQSAQSAEAPQFSAAPTAVQDPVKAKAITVRTGRLVCDVEIADPRFRYSSPRLSAFVSGQYPDLPQHACVNDEGMTFGYVMEKTSVAHLLEHLIISEQVRSQTLGNVTFIGTTEWIDEQAGLARIEVGFKDDLVALRAFNEATRFLNMAVLTCLA